MAQTQFVAEPGVPQILITREFAAPRELLFRAHVDPTLLVRWLGPRELTVTVDRWEAHDGGRWRYIHQDAGGLEHTMGTVMFGLRHARGGPVPDAACTREEHSPEVQP